MADSIVAPMLELIQVSVLNVGEDIMVEYVILSFPMFSVKLRCIKSTSDTLEMMILKMYTVLLFFLKQKKKNVAGKNAPSYSL